MRRISKLAAVVAFLVATALVAPFVPAGAEDASPRGRIVARDSSRIHQGEPLRYSLRVTNPLDTSVLVVVSLRVKRVGGTDAVPFRTWAASLGPSSSVRVRGSVIPSQWFSRTGEFAVVGVSETPIRSLPFDVLRSRRQVPRFEDVTTESGIESSIPSSNSCWFSTGAAWADVDGDEDLDLFMPRVTEPAQLWLNDDGTFTDGAAAAGVAGAGPIALGAVFGDYDNDGDPDLYVAGDGADQL